MRYLYQIFDKLIEKQIHFCFQSKSSHTYFSLMVKDRYGDECYLHSDDLNKIEENLKIIWGHLLEEYVVVGVTTYAGLALPTIPKPMSIPLPPGIPRPPR